jgi:hypothetical protein
MVPRGCIRGRRLRASEERDLEGFEQSLVLVFSIHRAQMFENTHHNEVAP